MTAPAVEQAAYDVWFEALRSQVGDQHASWCTKVGCDGVCATSETFGRYRLDAVLPREASTPVLTLTDLTSGDKVELPASVAAKISGLAGAWASPAALPDPAFRPRP